MSEDVQDKVNEMIKMKEPVDEADILKERLKAKYGKEDIENTLKKLKQLVEKAEGNMLSVVTFPPSAEEAEKVYVAGDTVLWATKGNVGIVLGMIRHKFHSELKEMEAKDKELVRK